MHGAGDCSESGLCSGHGTCVDGLCKCNVGWAGNNCTTELLCSYWDEENQMWSSQGLSISPPPGGAPDGFLHCNSSHLTDFGGIVRIPLSAEELLAEITSIEFTFFTMDDAADVLTNFDVAGNPIIFSMVFSAIGLDFFMILFARWRRHRRRVVKIRKIASERHAQRDTHWAEKKVTIMKQQEEARLKNIARAYRLAKQNNLSLVSLPPELRTEVVRIQQRLGRSDVVATKLQALVRNKYASNRRVVPGELPSPPPSPPDRLVRPTTSSSARSREGRDLRASLEAGAAAHRAAELQAQRKAQERAGQAGQRPTSRKASPSLSSPRVRPSRLPTQSSLNDAYEVLGIEAGAPDEHVLGRFMLLTRRVRENLAAAQRRGDDGEVHKTLLNQLIQARNIIEAAGRGTRAIRSTATPEQAAHFVIAAPTREQEQAQKSVLEEQTQASTISVTSVLVDDTRDTNATSLSACTDSASVSREQTPTVRPQDDASVLPVVVHRPPPTVAHRAPPTVAHRLPLNRVVAESLFKVVANGSARISIESMKAYLRERGDVHEEVIGRLVAEIGINSDGKMDLDEWTRGWVHVQTPKAAWAPLPPRQGESLRKETGTAVVSASGGAKRWQHMAARAKLGAEVEPRTEVEAFMPDKAEVEATTAVKAVQATTAVKADEDLKERLQPKKLGRYFRSFFGEYYRMLQREHGLVSAVLPAGEDTAGDRLRDEDIIQIFWTTMMGNLCLISILTGGAPLISITTIIYSLITCIILAAITIVVKVVFRWGNRLRFRRRPEPSNLTKLWRRVRVIFKRRQAISLADDSRSGSGSSALTPPSRFVPMSSRLHLLRFMLAWVFNILLFISFCLLAIIFGVTMGPAQVHEVILAWVLSLGFTWIVVEPTEILAFTVSEKNQTLRRIKDFLVRIVSNLKMLGLWPC